MVYTIGHSTRSKEQFLAILKAFEIELVVDIRTVPRSRTNPQYNSDDAKLWLNYLHMPGLGGLRHARKDSVNTAWRNPSFRGYADYMQTAEFSTALDELIRVSEQQRVAIMCAEAVPWRCHRSLVGDALLVRGIAVEEILSATQSRPHKLTPWAEVNGTQITYVSSGR